MGTTVRILVALAIVSRVAALLDDRCIDVPNLTYIGSPNACYLYYSCIDGNAYPHICDDDLWFSFEQQECVSPDESDCDLVDPTELPPAPPPEPSSECEGVENFSYLAATDSCQYYYQCIDGAAYRLSCPLYYWFSQQEQRCGTQYDFECDIDATPTDSTTVSFPTIGTPPTVDPLEICIGIPDYAIVGSYSLCERYYVCVGEIPYPQTCPAGQWFDRDEGHCDDPENVSCDLSTRPPNTTPTYGVCDGREDNYMVPNPNYCNQYYICQNGNGYPALCPPGMWFDEPNQTCGPPETVQCSIVATTTS